MPGTPPRSAQLLVTPGTFAYAHDDGFVLARMAGDEAEILTLAVAPQARGRGLGRALLQAVISKVQPKWGPQACFWKWAADNPAALCALCRTDLPGRNAKSLLQWRGCAGTQAFAAANSPNLALYQDIVVTRIEKLVSTRASA